MDKSKKLLTYFGCSFTAYNSLDISINRFLDIVKFQLKIDTIDLSQTGRANSHIIDDVYNATNKINSDIDNIFVIQTTFLNRLGCYSDLENKFTSITKIDTSSADNFMDTIYIDYYNKYLKYFYNSINALYEFEKQINFISSYLRYKKIKFIFLGIDEHLDLIKNHDFFIENNFLKFDNTYSFFGHAIKNKLRIHDLINNEDHHFNQNGHNIIAKKILDKLEY